MNIDKHMQKNLEYSNIKLAVMYISNVTFPHVVIVWSKEHTMLKFCN